MAADLSSDGPSSPIKCFDRFFAGNIAEFSHFSSRKTCVEFERGSSSPRTDLVWKVRDTAMHAAWESETLDGDNDRSLLRRNRAEGLLVFGPQPARDGFANILQSFVLVSALRYASGKGGTFGHNPAVFCRF
jgi:hypothetical protein